MVKKFTNWVKKIGRKKKEVKKQAFYFNILESLKVLDNEVKLSRINLQVMCLPMALTGITMKSMVLEDKLVEESESDRLTKFLEDIEVKFNVTNVKLDDETDTLSFILRAGYIIKDKFIKLPFENEMCFYEDDLKLINTSYNELLNMVINRFAEAYMMSVHFTNKDNSNIGRRKCIHSSILSEFKREEEEKGRKIGFNVEE